MGGHQQTITPFLTRAAKLHPDRELVTRTGEGIHRYTYAEYTERVARLAHALEELGVERRDRLGTFCYTNYRHFETFFGVPGVGAQLHTINPFLPEGHVDYIVDDASDKWIFVDPTLLEKLERSLDSPSSVERYVIMSEEVPDTSLEPVVSYESLLSDRPTEYEWPELDDELPAGMCYTSGTTGMPKGVEYTHKMIWSHSMACLTPQGYDVDDSDVIMSGVPMFHVNAMDSPFFCAAAGAKQVFPGPSPDPEDYVSLMVEEDVTLFFAVPTICLGIVEYVEEHDVDLSSLDRLQIGADAVSADLIERFERRGVDVLHGWGMTEALPPSTISPQQPGKTDWDREAKREKQVKIGRILPGLEFKAVDERGEEVPWDGESFGELYVRGPWVTTEYHRRPEKTEESFEGTWLKTGDIVTVDADGYLDLVDRDKYLIKSGGEWISSMQLEKTMETHDAVIGASVIGIPSEQWGERPVAYVVAKEEAGDGRLTGELERMLETEYPDWWTPDEFVYIEEIPQTATGKADKKELENRYDAR